jgi:5-methylcytosine-specific restriction endonuclease McrA
MKMVLDAASRTYMIGRMRRVEYLCSICKQFHPKKNVEVNHIVPAGSLRSYADIPEFCARLFSEDPANYEVLCKDCHLDVTKEQRKKI